MKMINNEFPLNNVQKNSKKYFVKIKLPSIFFILFIVSSFTVSCIQPMANSSKSVAISNINSANPNANLNNSNTNNAKPNANLAKSNTNSAKYSPTPYRSTVEDDITSRRNAECIRQRTAAGLDTSPCSEWSEER